MRILLVILFMLSSLAHADGLLYSNLLMSDDSDDNSLWSQELGLWYVKDRAFDIGISTKHTKYNKDSSSRLGFLFDKRFDNSYGIGGDIGIDSLGTTITGKFSLSKWFDYGSLKINAERGIVDSILGVEDGINFNMLYVQKDIKIENLSITGIVGKTEYSDNIDNSWYRLVSILPLNKSFNLFVQYRDQSFSGNSSYYFSPGEYARLLYGISTYHSVTDNFYIRSKFLYGYQRVFTRRTNSYLANVSLHYSKTDSPFEYSLDLISDAKEPEYSYNRVILNIIYRF